MDALLSKDYLKSIGIDMDDETFAVLAEHYETTLNTRIVDAIVELLDDDQLVEFQSIDTSDSELLAQWLTLNVPELSAIIEDEVAILMGEIAEHSDDI